MSTPHDIAHQMVIQQMTRQQLAQQEETVEQLRAMVDVMGDQARTIRAQADAARTSQKFAWWFTGGSLLVSAASLVVAILALGQ